MSQFFRTKPVELTIAESQDERKGLKRTLSAFALMMMGVGVTVGTGIFVLTGKVAGTLAGPAVAISFMIAAFATGLAALCYAELSGIIPASGSSYTFAYSALGEPIAWLIGWSLMLELIIGAAAVAVGWSDYFVDVMRNTLHWTIPDWSYGSFGDSAGQGMQHNLFSVVVVLGLTALLCFGIKTSSLFNNVIVVIKIAVVLLVIVAGLFFIQKSNYTPFVPPTGSTPAPGGHSAETLVQKLGMTPGAFGLVGIFTAAANAFFAFIGFDIVANTAEEVKNPQRNMPRGLIGALAIVTLLYVGVCLVVVGMVKYSQLSISAPLAEAFRAVGQNWIATVISVGSLIGITAVVMLMMLGQSRVTLAMSRDGLLPPAVSAINARTHTPIRSTIVTGVIVAILAGIFPLDRLVELVNIGTLFAFVMVAISVIVMRRKRPDLPRAFKVPWMPVLPILSALVSFYLMLNLEVVTWEYYLVWTVVGILVYLLYARRSATKHAAARASGDIARELAGAAEQLVVDSERRP